MNPQQNQPFLDLPKIIAVGIASPAGAALTSRFGVAGTLLGLALSAVIITVITDFLKTYLARVPGAVTSIPGGLQKKSAWGRFVHRIGLPFSKFASLSPIRRRRLLVGSLLGGAIAFLVGLTVVTALEFSVGKNLSCWLWDECPDAAVSSTDGTASNTSTLPSILSVGSSVSSNTQQGSPSASRPGSSPPASPGASPMSPSPSSSSKTPNPPLRSDQESSSNTGQYQQSSPEAPEYNPSPRSDQRTSSSNSSQYRQSSPESQQHSSQYQQSLSETSGNQQQSEDKSSSNKSGGQQQGSQREAPPIPLYWFTT